QNPPPPQTTTTPLTDPPNPPQTPAHPLSTPTDPPATPPTFTQLYGSATTRNIVHTIYIQITITSPDFSVSTSPSFLSIPQGNTGKTAVSLTSIDNFSGKVTLSISSSLYLSTSFSSNSVELTAGGSANTTLTIQTFSFTPPGSYYFQITATSGALVRYSQVSVYVIGPDYSLSAFPSFLVIPQGGSANSTISLTSLDNLNGTATVFVAFSNPI